MGYYFKISMVLLQSVFISSSLLSVLYNDDMIEILTW